MTILHIITRLILGGAQQNTVASCAAQVAAGHRVTLAHGPIYGPEGSLADEADATGAERVVIASLRRAVLPAHDVVCYRALRKLIRRVKPDVVHTHSSKAGIVGRAAAWAERVPAVIHTVHGLPFHERQNPLIRRAFIAAERWAAPRCHRMVGVTQAMVDTFVAHDIGRPEQYSVIPSGVDTAFWQDPAACGLALTNAPTPQHNHTAHTPPPNSSTITNAHLRTAIRAELNIPPDAPVIGLVARLDPLKGHGDLLRLGPRLVERFPDVRFLFVGDGWARKQVEQQARDAGVVDRVIFTGLVSLKRAAALYRAMDVSVLPSYQEGQPRVLVESLLTGCPIVGYDAGGIEEICIDGETGRLVTCGDVDSLCDAIVWTLEHRAAALRMTAAGRERANERFSQTAMCEQLEALYREVLG